MGSTEPHSHAHTHMHIHNDLKSNKIKEVRSQIYVNVGKDEVYVFYILDKVDSKERQNREKWEQRKNSPPAKERKSKSDYYKTWCFVPDDDGCGCDFCTTVCLPVYQKSRLFRVRKWNYG